MHFQERPPTLENAVFGACRLSAALGAAQGNHRKHRRSRGRGKALPCPILRANAHHVSLRAAAGGEAIPLSAAGDCFGGHAAAQQHHGVALESGKSPQGDFASSRCSFNCRRGGHHMSLRAARQRSNPLHNCGRLLRRLRRLAATHQSARRALIAAEVFANRASHWYNRRRARFPCQGGFYAP